MSAPDLLCGFPSQKNYEKLLSESFTSYRKLTQRIDFIDVTKLFVVNSGQKRAKNVEITYEFSFFEISTEYHLHSIYAVYIEHLTRYGWCGIGFWHLICFKFIARGSGRWH